MKKHISFSELKNWDTCAFYHKLTYLDKVKLFQGNEFTAFGNALHETCEYMLLLDEEEEFNPSNYFVHKFINHLEELKVKNIELDKKLLKDMYDQGKELAQLVMPSLKEHFGEYEVVATEQELYEDIDIDLEKEKYFKGYIDLIIKTKDGKYHVIDWKTCSWGWDARRKADKITNYQLTLYKHYCAKKLGLDPKKVETYFALLKRTAKKNKVEIFRVSSGQKKTNNALNLLTKALYNIENKNFIKNRLSCKRCEFYKTEHCN